MKEVEKIAIITRTSNRPNYFNKCYRSAQSQNHCVHHVIYDNERDLKYLKDKNLILHKVDHNKLKEGYNEPAPASARPPLLSIHNLYFNEVYPKIKERWCYHLDDDNQLIGVPLQNLIKDIHPSTDLIICKVKHFSGILPRPNLFKTKTVRLGAIDTGCFIAKTELLKKVNWDGWKCGDFRFISNLVKHANRTEWKDICVLNIERQNLGRKNDIK